jgi:hypothetical protein
MKSLTQVFAVVLIGLSSFLNPVEAKPKNGKCHACVAVYGSVLECQEYTCPKEGANGGCSGVVCKYGSASDSIREGRTVPAKAPVKK